MKLALLLPGYLDSPEYLHLLVIEKGLKQQSYEVVRLDPCNLWETGNASTYSITNYLKNVMDTINAYKEQKPTEIILVGHSVGGFVSIVAGEKYPEVTKIIALCPPSGFDNPPVKWDANGYRISKRDLPEDKTRFREFSVPISFAYDGIKYNAIDAVKRIDKPLMIFTALDDTVVPPEDTEKLIQAAKKPYVVRLNGIEHNFRNSEKECTVVMGEIEKFLLSL